MSQQCPPNVLVTVRDQEPRTGTPSHSPELLTRFHPHGHSDVHGHACQQDCSHTLDPVPWTAILRASCCSQSFHDQLPDLFRYLILTTSSPFPQQVCCCTSTSQALSQTRRNFDQLHIECCPWLVSSMCSSADVTLDNVARNTPAAHGLMRHRNEQLVSQRQVDRRCSEPFRQTMFRKFVIAVIRD